MVLRLVLNVIMPEKESFFPSPYAIRKKYSNISTQRHRSSITVLLPIDIIRFCKT